MKSESVLANILEQKDVRNMLGIVAALAIAFILGRQIAAGHFFFPMALFGFAVFILVFFRKESVIYLMPMVLFLPNQGLDIPGPWAVTIQDAFILMLFSGHLSRCIIRRDKVIPRQSPIIFPLAVYIIVACISLFKSVQVDAGSFLYNAKDLMRLTELFLLYITLYDVFDSTEKVERLIRNLLILGVAYAAVSFYIYLTLSPFFYGILTMVPAYIYIKPHEILRMVSIAGSTSQTGMFYAVLLAFALFFSPLKTTRNRQLLRGLLIVLFISCIALTFNRGTWAGILLASTIVLLKGGLDWKKIVLFSVVLILLATVLLFTVFGQLDVEKQALTFFHVSKNSGLARWVRWVSAVNVLAEHPLMGVGYNNYAWVYGRYSILEGDVQEYGSPHNMFVDIVTGTGVIGFGVFMFFLMRLFKMISRCVESKTQRLRELSLGLYFAFFSFIGASIFDSFFYKPHHTGVLIVTTWALITTLWRAETGNLSVEEKTGDLPLTEQGQ